MKAIVVGVVVLGLNVLPALARAGEAGAPFSGAYVGVNAGVARGSAGFRTDPGCPSIVVDAVFCNAAPDSSVGNGAAVADSGGGHVSGFGFTGGIQAGYNERKNTIVYGIETDFGLLDFDESKTNTGTFPFAFLGTSYALEQTMSTDWLATLRGRVGRIVTPKLLLYATGGLALTELKVSTRYNDNAIDGTFPGGTGTGSDSSLRLGWTLGLGGEWLLDGLWSVKTEYLYANFGSKAFYVPTSNTAAFQQTMRVNADLDTHILRVGLNYRF